MTKEAAPSLLEPKKEQRKGKVTILFSYWQTDEMQMKVDGDPIMGHIQYHLVEADSFVKDLHDCEPSLQESVCRKLQFLEQNPRHPSLDTRDVESMPGILRSKMTGYHRLYWFYHPNRRAEIVLWRIGPRTWTDRLKHFPLPDTNDLIPSKRPVRTTEPAAHAPGSSNAAAPLNAFFSDVHPNHLILLGVPEDKVEAVKGLADIDNIYDLGLPGHAEQVLVELYTAGCWGTDRLVRADLVFYRANADELESFCKGKTTKLLLDLHPDQRKYAYVRTNGPLLVKGVAGSGKTTIGLYRALHLAQQLTLFPGDPDILFVTYNETLATSVDQLFCELREQETCRTIEVTTLRDWIKRYLDIDEGQIASKKQQQRCLSAGIRCARERFPDIESMHRKGNDFFAEEIADVIKGRNLLTLDDYRRVERHGRDRGLRRKNQRPFVWKVYQTYQQEMRRANLYDYEDLPLLALKELGSQSDGALYEAVIVDEAQDLRPAEIELVALIAGGRKSPRLTLLADPQQSIYYKGISWREAGVEVIRGIQPLSKNFRNTRQILEAAWSLAEHGVEDPGDLVLPETTCRQGPKPRVIVRENWADQVQAVEEIVLRLCQSGRHNPGDFAVLAYKRDQVHDLYRRLQRASIPVAHYRDEAFDIREYNAKTITMHSAKGLEWPVVIVAGLQQGILPWNRPSGNREEEIESGTARQRKVLYVAMTRAIQELYLISSPPTSAFLDEIDRQLVTWDASLGEH